MEKKNSRDSSDTFFALAKVFKGAQNFTLARTIAVRAAKTGRKIWIVVKSSDGHSQMLRGGIKPSCSAMR